jgi:succinate dehydrogenase / fumarate reductase, cytochrome b subunit
MVEQQLSATPAGRARPKAAGKHREPMPANPALALWSTAVGKKVVMAVTGVILVGFVIAHMLGNLKIFLGQEAIDKYALFLREVGEPLFPYEVLLWAARIILLISVVLHIVAAVELTRMNWAARPQNYTAKKALASTYASRTMRYSGVIVGLFVVYHLLHFTAGLVGYAPGQFGHLKVYSNVVAGFSVWYVSLFYILAMAALCLHLDHGIWSMFQTLGLNNNRAISALRTIARAVAILVFAGFISVPVAVLAGWVQ